MPVLQPAMTCPYCGGPVDVIELNGVPWITCRVSCWLPREMPY